MAAATPDAVRGDFNDARFTHRGVTSRFFRRGDKFMVHTDGPDGRLADFEISHTFGVDPLQQYLIAMTGGRLQRERLPLNSSALRLYCAHWPTVGAGMGAKADHGVRPIHFLP